MTGLTPVALAVIASRVADDPVRERREVREQFQARYPAWAVFSYGSQWHGVRREPDAGVTGDSEAHAWMRVCEWEATAAALLRDGGRW